MTDRLHCRNMSAPAPNFMNRSTFLLAIPGSSKQEESSSEEELLLLLLLQQAAVRAFGLGLASLAVIWQGECCSELFDLEGKAAS